MSNNPDIPMPEEGGDPDFMVSAEQLQMLAGGNPALLEAIQKGLARMVGSSSGYIESLPAPIRSRIHHLESIQEEYEQLEEQFDEEMKALEEKYRKLYLPILDKRSAVINGEVEAPENETEEGKKELAAAGDIPPGVPDFWAAAISNHPELEERITDKDREVLAYVTDIRAEDLFDEDGDDEGFKIIFKFKENPFLTDSELTVNFFITEERGYLQVREIEGCDIHWRPDKDVTVKKMRKKPKPGAKNKAPQTKLEPVESFFRWFTDVPEVPDHIEPNDAEEDDELEELRDLVEAHMHVGEIFREEIVPHAVKWYTGEALEEMDGEDFDEDDDEDEDDDSAGAGDSEDDEDDDDDDSDDEGGPGGVMPKDSKEQPAECKQQ